MTSGVTNTWPSTRTYTIALDTGGSGGFTTYFYPDTGKVITVRYNDRHIKKKEWWDFSDIEELFEI